MTEIKTKNIITGIKKNYRSSTNLINNVSKITHHFIHDEYEDFLNNYIEDDEIMEEFTTEDKSDEEWLDLIESTPYGTNHILYNLVLLRFHFGV